MWLLRARSAGVGQASGEETAGRSRLGGSGISIYGDLTAGVECRVDLACRQGALSAVWTRLRRAVGHRVNVVLRPLERPMRDPKRLEHSAGVAAGGSAATLAFQSAEQGSARWLVLAGGGARGWLPASKRSTMTMVPPQWGQG